ncbi:MAG: hypothetical protein K2W79_12460 [Hydrotalea flava]|nr:hypothetical protein [Hydrotalea flava]
MNNLKKIAAFYGEVNNPLLAPRGVYLHQHTLVVSDTGQNRVFIWYNFSFQSHQQSDVVLGQKENNDTERNAGKMVSASSLQYPSGIWTNDEKLIVADAWNHRVLIWHKMPSHNFQEADVVVGQMDFKSNQTNAIGIGKAPTAQTLNWPYGVYSNGTALWIADTGNRRVLYFSSIPTTNFAAADAVIGQETFADKDYDNNNAVWPYAVKLSNNGAIAIIDTQYYRVLLWNYWKDALTKTADVILGQKNINDNGQNQYRLKPNANTLNWVYDACFYKNGIAVADTGNSRLIIHHQIPTLHGATADMQIGQPNFETHGETSLSMKTTFDNEMYWPFGINCFNDILVAADTGNHRILFYR